MNQRTKFWIRGITLWCLATISPAQAQVTTDGTLSTKVKTTNNRDFTITSGAQAGANLFHSFSQFSVPTNGSVVFNNANKVQNIISRVTGSSNSRIDGLLEAQGTANLFLLNPNGIIFGPNASLDIGGSFLASTANSLNFADGSQFGVVTPEAAPLLTVSVPTGLQFGVSARPIDVDTSFLNVPPGKMLTLVGGNVNIDGGYLEALGGRVELGGVAGGGTVGLDVNGNNLRLVPDDVGRANVVLTNGADINVAGAGGGSIAINAQNLDILAESDLFAGISQGAVEAQAGDITLNATGAITIQESDIFNNLDPNTIGKGGSITIQSGSLALTDRASLRTTTSGQGNAGDISVNVSESVSLRDGFIFSFVGEEADGDGGNIAITAGSFFAQGSTQLNSSTNGTGDAGNITIRASDIVSFEQGDATSEVQGKKAIGDAGNIDIDTGSLFVKNGALLAVGTRGEGDAGNVIIKARDTVLFDNGGIVSEVQGKKVEGTAGNIDIDTGSLFIKNGALLAVSTRGIGNSGNVIIKARDTVRLDGVTGTEGIRASVLREAEGNAGDIDITAKSLFVNDGPRIATNTFGQGDAGNVTIKADTVSFDGVGDNGFSSGAFSFVGGEAKGNGGSINITTESFSVKNGAVLSAINDANDNQGVGGNVFLETKTFEALGGGQVLTTTRGPGQAGDITLNATGSVVLDGRDLSYFERVNEHGERVVFNSGPNSGLFANTSAKSPINGKTTTGPGGNLSINTRQLTVHDEAEVSASTAGSGPGGILTVTALESITLSGEGGLLTQATAGGDAGSLTINTRQLAVQDGAEVSAKTTLGKGGDIKLEGLNVLQVSNGQISASTRDGQAGSLSVDAAESIELSGKGGLSVEATEGGTAGSTAIYTEQLNVENGAAVTVSSPTGQAGNLSITANTVRLDKGSLTAQTGAKPDEVDRVGANINLYDLDLLLLQNDSLISANATGDANGGNINIKTAANGFIFAIPSEDSDSTTNASDIIANASAGRGGNIEIQTQGIFGIQERRATPGNGTNDIDASSEFGLEGNVTINTPDVDPNQGLVALPEEVIDTSGLIAQGCPAGVGLATSKFVVTGRGGLPPIPRETVSSDTILEDWGTLPLASAQSQDVSAVSEPSRLSEQPENLNTPNGFAPGSNSTPIIEAQGWVTSPQGEVVLTAQAPTVIPQSSRPSTPDCHRLQTSSNPLN